MKERPILFSTEIVKAILEDRKTQTRRVARIDGYGFFSDGVLYGAYKLRENGKKTMMHCPYGQPADILWVRETWNNLPDDDGDNYVYKADGGWDELSWKPSIHMPRAAARLFLKVINVRVERLQAITQEDIEREGLWFYSQEYRDEICQWRDFVSAIQNTRRKYFKKLWDSINAKRGYGWEINPWVWAIEFERIQP